MPSNPDPQPADTGTAEKADPAAATIEEINRETLPKGPDGQLVDPKQDEVKDEAG